MTFFMNLVKLNNTRHAERLLHHWETSHGSKCVPLMSVLVFCWHNQDGKKSLSAKNCPRGDVFHKVPSNLPRHVQCAHPEILPILFVPLIYFKRYLRVEILKFCNKLA